MKKAINRIYRKLNEETVLERKYPGLKVNDGKVHILYLHCLINASGLYRMLLPVKELNRSNSHRAIIGTMHRWDYRKSFSDYDNHIEKELIEWADYLIIPPVDIDLSAVLKEFEQINHKLKWVMDIDEASYLDTSPMNLLQSNLSQMHMISCPSVGIADKVEELLKKFLPNGKSPLLAIIPNLISQDSFVHLPLRKANESTVFRLGIVGTPAIAKDMLLLKEALQEAFIKLETKVKLVLLGWDGKHDKTDLFPKVDKEVYPAVNILDYYSVLHRLQLDAALLPPSLNANADKKSAIKFIELAALGVPLLTDVSTVYNRLIVDRETGYVAKSKQDWTRLVIELVNDELHHKELGQYAQKFAWRNWSWNRSKTAQLAATFPPLQKQNSQNQ